MNVKKWIVLSVVVCLMLAGCGNARDNEGESTVPADTQATSSEATDVIGTEAGNTIAPIPDTTMENLTDAVLSVSLTEEDAYVDDTGIMRMDLKIYSYDIYDMVDIANLQVGDTIVTHSGEVKVTSKEQKESGVVSINGGLEAGGMDLITDDSGLYYERGFNDARNWYEAGEATIRVSTEFECFDYADLDQGEVIYYPGSFLVGEVTNYDFTPYNTTIRVQEGQIVEMTRRYTP